ncbi:MAG: hypothetical protein H6736_19965 [Alphaproteobacteria bacterium]|nr:hypothetical protein [Alphaproteobacteria bacterium]MCB9694091.1 hypothetical protein [Alphaproteobacteria bacterium]
MSDKLFDVRLQKHHIRRQVLTPEQVQAHLDTLEDVAAMGEPTNTRFQTLGLDDRPRVSDDDEEDDD